MRRSAGRSRVATLAVRTILSKFLWGNEDGLHVAITGWNRFNRKEGIYSTESTQHGQLQRAVNNPVDFFTHVKAMSTLAGDQ
eukprot:2215498-Prymnesium_polylepis.1